MKDHAQYADNLALYAVGALADPQELADLKSHLGSCGDCRRELEALRADSAMLALSATGPQPPQRARLRLMQTIAAEARHPGQRKPRVLGRLRPRWRTFAPITVAATLAVISIGLMVNNLKWRRNYEELAAQYQELKTNSALAREVMDMINDPKAVHMTLVSVKTAAQPQVRAVYKPERGHILLLANNLAPIPDDKVYELWLLPATGGTPMPAGTFRIDSKGSAMMMHAMQTEGIQARAFAITIEPAGGSRAPTSPIMMSTAA